MISVKKEIEQICLYFLLFMQTFVVPQNFTDVTFNDNLQVYGHLNGNDMDQLFDDTVNRNEPAQLKHVIFGKQMQIHSQKLHIEFCKRFAV